MNGKTDLNETAREIIRDAPGWHVDLQKPENAFTVWTYSSDRRRMLYCGSRLNLDAAYVLAAAHTGLKRLFVFKAPINQYGILRIRALITAPPTLQPSCNIVQWSSGTMGIMASLAI